jgi:hypothetical protein
MSLRGKQNPDGTISIGRESWSGHVKKVEIDGYQFDSSGEGLRYRELKYLLMNNVIKDFKIHPRFPLVINDIKVGHYTPDFQYTEVITGKTVVEEHKGFASPLYKFRARVFQALYPQFIFYESRSR